MDQDEVTGKEKEPYVLTATGPFAGSVQWWGPPEDIRELRASLARARGKMAKVARDAQGQDGNRKFAYSPMAALTDVTVGPLAEEGIFVTQPISGPGEDGLHRVTTIVCKGLAEMVSVIRFEGEDDQKAFGSQTTYFRRYAHNAIFQLDSPDDAKADPEQGGGNTRTGGRRAPPPMNRPQERREPPRQREEPRAGTGPQERREPPPEPQRREPPPKPRERPRSEPPPMPPAVEMQGGGPEDFGGPSEYEERHDDRQVSIPGSGLPNERVPGEDRPTAPIPEEQAPSQSGAVSQELWVELDKATKALGFKGVKLRKWMDELTGKAIQEMGERDVKYLIQEANKELGTRR